MQSHYSVDQFGREQLKLEITHVKPVSLALQPCLFENRDGLVYNLCRAPAGVAGWRQRGRKKGRVNRWEGGCMKVTVDRSKCEGYAKCVEVTPKVFKLD